MSSDGQIPEFQRIYDHYRDQITNGTLLPGERLPTSKDMADEWDVSQATTRRAMAMLKAEGLTTATTRAGTIVAHSPVGFSGHLAPHPVVRQMASTFGAGTDTIYTFAGYDAAPSDVATALGVTVGAAVVRRERQRRLNDQPITMSTSWHPAQHGHLLPELLEPVNIEGGLHTIEVACNTTIGTLRERIAASSANEQHAEFFEFDLPAAVLLKEHLWLDTDGHPFCYGQGVHRPGEWSEYHVILPDA